jgi:hypothetical protein
MRLMFALCCLFAVICLSDSASASPVTFIKHHGAVQGGGFVMSANRRYFAISTEAYFQAPWDLYEVRGASARVIRSGTGWLIGIENDGTTLEYNQTTLNDDFLAANRFGCSLTTHSTSGAAHELMAFTWPPVADPDISFENAYECPRLSVTDARASRRVIGVSPLVGYRISSGDPSFALSAGFFYLVEGGDATLQTTVTIEDYTSAFTGQGSVPTGVSWVNSNGDIVIQVAGPQTRIGLLTRAGQSTQRFAFAPPFEIVGLSDAGMPLLSARGVLYSRADNGALTRLSQYAPVATAQTIFNKEEDSNQLPQYDVYNRQRVVALRGRSGLKGDANCYLPNSFGWRINSVIGNLSTKKAVVLMSLRRSRRLAIVDVSELKRQDLYCNAQIHTEVLGGPDCASRSRAEMYGARIQASEYEALPINMRCGFRVSVTDADGRPAAHFPTVLLSSRYVYSESDSVRKSIAEQRFTNSAGTVDYWIDITVPDGQGGGSEVGETFIASPYGDRKYRSNGVLVYDRYSHL